MGICRRTPRPFRAALQRARSAGRGLRGSRRAPCSQPSPESWAESPARLGRSPKIVRSCTRTSKARPTELDVGAAPPGVEVTALGSKAALRADAGWTRANVAVTASTHADRVMTTRGHRTVRAQRTVDSASACKGTQVKAINPGWTGFARYREQPAVGLPTLLGRDRTVAGYCRH